MFRYVLILLLGIFFSLFSLQVQADQFTPKAAYTVCFTPGGNCTQAIVEAINSSVDSVRIQAYSFTSRPIGAALVKARERGVKIEVIFDKSALAQNQKTLQFLARRGVVTWIDKQPAIAHNKVMIIDQTQVITGSFNFTYAAQEKNAENVLIISDATLARKYLKNWQQRRVISDPYQLIGGGNRDELQQSTNWLEKLFKQIWYWLENLLTRSH